MNFLFLQTLLKAFLRNLNSDSIEIRRAAAFCLITICEFSRKPQFFFSHLISILLGNFNNVQYYSTMKRLTSKLKVLYSHLDSLSHSQQLGDVNKVYIQGCLSSIRQVLPHFHQLLTCNDALVEKLLQVGGILNTLFFRLIFVLFLLIFLLFRFTSSACTLLNFVIIM